MTTACCVKGCRNNREPGSPGCFRHLDVLRETCSLPSCTCVADDGHGQRSPSDGCPAHTPSRVQQAEMDLRRAIAQRVTVAVSGGSDQLAVMSDFAIELGIEQLICAVQQQMVGGSHA